MIQNLFQEKIVKLLFKLMEKKRNIRNANKFKRKHNYRKIKEIDNVLKHVEGQQ